MKSGSSPIYIDVKNGQIVIQTPPYDLDDMLHKINTENQQHQLLDDAKKGHEEW